MESQLLWLTTRTYVHQNLGRWAPVNIIDWYMQPVFHVLQNYQLYTTWEWCWCQCYLSSDLLQVPTAVIVQYTVFSLYFAMLHMWSCDPGHVSYAFTFSPHVHTRLVCVVVCTFHCVYTRTEYFYTLDPWSGALVQLSYVRKWTYVRTCVCSYVHTHAYAHAVCVTN